MDPESGNTFDVIIVGGGATGAGTARDCALRGLRVLLLERYDYTNGATGRNHGLLHSGARYAVKDAESAVECIRENKILKAIAPDCVEDTSGLFVSLPEDGLDYQKQFIACCKKAGIETEKLLPKEALRLEPSVNPSLLGAVRVPDGSIDPFRLTLSNIQDACTHGAVARNYHEVTGFVREQDRIMGVEVTDLRRKQKLRFFAPVVVNACGIWGQKMAELAGVRINMYPAKGALLIFGHRVNNVVLNRCRKAADADILVPGNTVSIIGTTSTRVPLDSIDHMHALPEEVNLLLREGAKLAPVLAKTRILRAYAGVRPLVAADDDATGRNISRGIVLLDHETRDGLKGFVTITGGKLMTYRLMAEKTTDLICKKLGVKTACKTAVTPLPALQKGEVPAETTGKHKKKTVVAKPAPQPLVCECEHVGVDEVMYAIRNLGIDDLSSLRRRTRIGMGTCQGELCLCRAAGLLADHQKGSSGARRNLVRFLNERWKGMYPIAWENGLRQSQYMEWMYKNVCGLTSEEGGSDEI